MTDNTKALDDSEWKIIDNYNQRYAISKTGIVKNIKRNKEVKCFPNCRGYLMVRFYNDGKYHTKAVHRLVAENFLSCPKGVPVNHINRDKLNNRANNLEISSTRENTTYYHNREKTGAYKNGNRWYSTISINNKNIYLGMFATRDEANAAYREALTSYGLENKYVR